MDRLHVVTAIFNPIRWKTRIDHYKVFREHMLQSGVDLTVVECAFGQRPHELGNDQHVEHIAVRAETLAWNKENLINIGFARSRHRSRKVAWIDADVIFQNRHWREETEHALEQYKVVQPWASALDMGPDGEPMLVKGFHVQTSFAKVWHKTMAITPDSGMSGAYAAGWQYPHPGYAWAAQREALNKAGGLIEASGLGAGDHQMAMAFVGKIENAIHGATHPDYQANIRSWAERAYKIVQGEIGHVNGTVSHLFHGQKDKRRYHERWQILIEEKFNPVTDLRRNLDGVLELAGNKPRMAHRFDQYLRERDEDQNILL